MIVVVVLRWIWVRAPRSPNGDADSSPHAATHSSGTSKKRRRLQETRRENPKQQRNAPAGVNRVKNRLGIWAVIGESQLEREVVDREFQE
ncbi:hypothetical protein L596_017748 [Steinernema carpocapsae]|uniref:Uncharacterized protein n=1 Tax=Steinernema carpocapsae TaxID=34508 RepID=A0A4V6A1Z5_STECR|nr:hypothetical protein L596_017748 [Steinernema carpocapsae]